VLPVATGAFLLVERYVTVPVLRGALAYVVAGAAWAGLAWWVRANRVALDQLEWCSCAADTVQVRVIASARV